MGRRKLLARGAGVGVAASIAGLGVVVPAALAQDDELDKLKSDVRKAYDTSKSEVEKAGDKITDGTKDVYDELKKEFDRIGDDIDAAGKLTGKEAKRAWRDIQHELRAFDREVERVMHDADKGVKDTWSDIRGWFSDVHDGIDHVIDRL